MEMNGLTSLPSLGTVVVVGVVVVAVRIVVAVVGCEWGGVPSNACLSRLQEETWL